MEQLSLIRSSVTAMEGLSLPYYITGSIASNFYGNVRYTHDLDIVVVMGEGDIEGIFNAFSKDCYIDRDAIREALKEKSTFNAIHNTSGLKTDFWIRKDSPFDLEMFQRRKKEEIAEGLYAFLATPEDVILSKLLWARATTSERQLIDAKGVYEVQKENLDMDYLRAWAEKLGLSNDLEQLIKSPPPNTF